MDLKLILVLLLGLFGLGYAIPRVRRDIMEQAVPIENAGVVASAPNSDNDLESSEHRHGGYGGGYGGYGGGYGGYGGGYGGLHGNGGHGHGHHHHHNGHIDYYDY